MAERKVINKYYPPDFDASKLRSLRKNNGPATLPTIRVVTPFSMRCTSCSTYIYKGRKFNAKKEKIEETYLSIPIHRLYIRCTGCSSEICFKTDPKSTGYVCERGAVRNCEPWKNEAKQQGQKDKDVLAAVVDKMMGARAEMAVADALDDIRIGNARRELAAKHRSSGPANRHLDEEQQRSIDDEKVADKAFNPTGERTRRLPDDTTDSGDIESSNYALTFKRSKRQKKDYTAALGLNKK